MKLAMPNAPGINERGIQQRFVDTVCARAPVDPEQRGQRAQPAGEEDSQSGEQDVARPSHHPA